MSISIIAAIGKNNEIGKNNKLLWHLPNDLPFFKKMTDGKIVVMGKNTFESLPKVLPNRKNIVLTHEEIKNSQIYTYYNFETILDDLLKEDSEVFIIGGGKIYSLFLEYADKIYLTEVDKSDSEADTFFPQFNKNEYEKEVIDTYSDENISYEHVIYTRK